MKLSDVMSQMGLASYAEVGLVIFFLVFVALSIDALRGDPKGSHRLAERLPLDDAEPERSRHE
jgi:hypothetical protein